MNRTSLALVALALSVSVHASGRQIQQTPAPPSVPPAKEEDVVRIASNLVQVDAVVVDKAGRQVTDLRPEDFEILEAGRPQKITNFSYVALGRGPGELAAPAAVAASSPTHPEPLKTSVPPAPSAPPRPEQVRRTIALVVDDLGLSHESVNQVRRALKNFVDEQMQPNDLVAVVRTSSGVGSLQNFTNDRRQLHAAIERVRWTSSASGINDLAQISLPPFTIRADRQGRREDFGQRREVFAVGTLGALRNVVAGLGQLPGRKSLVLFSEGFPLATFDRVLGGRQDKRDRVTDATERFIEAANRASVVVYSVDTRGMATPWLTGADDLAGVMQEEGGVGVLGRVRNRGLDVAHSRESLSHMAASTGGLLITSNDLGQAVRRALGDEQGYYLIGYRPEEVVADPAVSRPQVEVRVKRPGLVVRARTGFYAGSGRAGASTTMPRTREEQLADALSSPFNSGGFDVRLTTLFNSVPSSGPLVRALVYVNARDLTFSEERGRWRADFDVVAVAYDADGRAVDRVGRTLAMSVGKGDYESALRNGLVYAFNLFVKKHGAYQVRVAVRDAATGRTGSASQFTKVPETKNRLALSGVVLDGYDPTSPAAAASATGEVSARDAAGGGDDPEATAAVRRFSRGTVLRYAFEVYDSRPATASARTGLTTRVRLLREDRVMFAGAERVLRSDSLASNKRMAVGGSLRLGRELEPGHYLLQVVVTDASARGGAQVAEQWAELEIK